MRNKGVRITVVFPAGTHVRTNSAVEETVLADEVPVDVVVSERHLMAVARRALWNKTGRAQSGPARAQVWRQSEVKTETVPARARHTPDPWISTTECDL
jgi:hypothetical protein